MIEQLILLLAGAFCGGILAGGLIERRFARAYERDPSVRAFRHQAHLSIERVLADQCSAVETVGWTPSAAELEKVVRIP